MEKVVIKGSVIKKSNYVKINVFIIIVSMASFVISCLPFIQAVMQINGDKKQVLYSGWDLMQISSNMNGMLILKIFNIAILVLSSIVIILASIQILKDMDIIKFGVTIFIFLACILMAVFLILAVIGTFFVSGAMSADEIANTSTSISFGVWLQISMALIWFVFSLFQLVNAKNKVKY